MRRLLATALGLGLGSAILAMLVLQRWVAENDDRILVQRPRCM